MAARWLFTAAIFLLLATGAFAPFAPYSLLHKLPVFSSERAPARFLIPFVFTVSVMAAFGADWLQKSRGRLGMTVASLLVGATLVDMWSVSTPNLKHLFDGDVSRIQASKTLAQMGGETQRRMLPITQANMGAVRCYEYTEFASNALGFNQRGYRGEQYLLGPGAVTLVDWTPNALTYDVDTPDANITVINQNYDPGWRLERGTGEVADHYGLLAVHIPPGRQQLRLRYRSRPFVIGATITIATMLASAGLLYAERRRFSTLTSRN